MLEDALFSYEDSYTLNNSHVCIDCILRQPIGNYPKDQSFGAIFIDYTSRRISFYNDIEDEDPVFEADIKLVVV